MELNTGEAPLIAEADKDNQRKRLLIDPRFQINFISYTCAVGAIISGILFFANRYFFWKLEKRGTDLGLPSDHVFFKFLLEQKATLDVIYAGTAALSFLVLIIFGLYFSNRIAGPIYNVRKNLAERLKGVPRDKIIFRKNDYFHELADSLNEYFDKKD